jgi:hypothetical protein
MIISGGQWMKAVKRWMGGGLRVAELVAGMLIYAIRRRTPAFAHHSMISLFCLTGGRSNDILSRAIGLVRRPYRFSRAGGLLGDMLGKERREQAVSALLERGYCVFERVVPPDLCDNLLRFATTHPSQMRRMDADKPGALETTIYRRGAPRAVRYDFNTQDLLNDRDVQQILADASFAALAQAYFGSRPVIDVLSMWWHTDFSGQPDSEAGQYFHFDMDRPKWLKFFIYLTDVKTANGPHSFVAGSHRSGRIPSSLLRKGYVRLTDEEVEREFPRSDIIEFAAPRGTVIVEDTRGLHKGKHVEEGDRLILQIQFSNSLFGALYPKATMGRDLCTPMSDRVHEFPGIYAAYL